MLMTLRINKHHEKMEKGMMIVLLVVGMVLLWCMMINVNSGKE